MQKPIVTRADGKPAYINAPPFIRQSDCNRYGGFEAAKVAVGRNEV